MKKVLVIDNYDSFTYNLVHYLKALNCVVSVYRNNEFELDEISSFDKIVLSPGPGLPNNAGLLKDVIIRYSSSKSILGICLGHQAIGEVFGGKLKNLNTVYHGIASEIEVINKNDVIFKNVPTKFQAGRYHSWVVSKENFPVDLEISSVDINGEIMSLSHTKFDVKGIQFHPESILTPVGKQILENWLNS